jgi:hypothetical protein
MIGLFCFVFVWRKHSDSYIAKKRS